MLMARLDYVAPVGLQKAIDVLGQFRERAKVLAGGTDLIIALQREAETSDILVDIGKIAELKEIKKVGSILALGAAVTFTDIIRHPLTLKFTPLLVQAASVVGSPQIRNRGTIGGTLGTASPAGDLLTPLIALEAEIFLEGPKGRRKVRAGSFLGGSDKDRLQPDEIICGVLIPLPENDTNRSTFIKLGRRKALAVSRLNLALYLEMEGPTIVRARLAVGSAGPAPFRVAGAEEILVKKGSGIEGPEIMDQVSRAVEDSLGNRPSAPYKIEAVKGMTWEALVGCGLVMG